MRIISEVILTAVSVRKECIQSELQVEAWRRNGAYCFRAEFLKLGLKLHFLVTMTAQMLSKESDGCTVKSMTNNPSRQLLLIAGRCVIKHHASASFLKLHELHHSVGCRNAVTSRLR